MPLGETLIRKGQLTQAQLDKALDEQKKSQGKRIGEILVALGYVTDEQVKAAL